jgi:phytoene synthase
MRTASAEMVSTSFAPANGALSLAYSHCERVTRARARNFYYGIRLLPEPKRSAMCALYAMARRIDDVGDGAPDEGPGTSPGTSPGGTDRKLMALGEIRASLSLLPRGPHARDRAAVPPGDPVLIALADTARRFDLPVSAFDELVEGCEWDLTGREYATFDDLVQYCRRVAGSIGRLSLSIYTCADPAAAEPLADALGVALQLTNILRDLVEDRDTMGRVYLPVEDLERFGVGPGLSGKPDDLLALICFETGRATTWYERGLALLPLLDKRSRACTAAMAGIYRHLLDRIRRDPAAVLRGRLSLSAAEKAAVAAKALVGTVP